MIKITDINGWLKPPADYTLTKVEARGSFIVASYYKRLDPFDDLRWSTVEIYLTQEGREVARTEETKPDRVHPTVADLPYRDYWSEAHPSWWKRFIALLWG